MSTALYASAALLLSSAALLRLALHDPKRLRSLRLPLQPEPRRRRRALASACLAPGVLLAALGQWPALLIWLGGLCAGGWLLVQWLARTQPSGATTGGDRGVPATRVITSLQATSTLESRQ